MQRAGEDEAGDADEARGAARAQRGPAAGAGRAVGLDLAQQRQAEVDAREQDADAVGGILARVEPAVAVRVEAADAGEDAGVVDARASAASP